MMKSLFFILDLIYCEKNRQLIIASVKTFINIGIASKRVQTNMTKIITEFINKLEGYHKIPKGLEVSSRVIKQNRQDDR